jgi:hypothetical protein
MGRIRRDRNDSPQKKNNNSIQDTVGNEENGYPVPDPNKTVINAMKKPIDFHKITLIEEILEEISEKFMEKILDMVTQNVQDALKKFQDNKNKEHEKTQKQINEIREDFNKHQCETNYKKTLKITTQNIKEELNTNVEDLRKKNETEILEIESPFSQTKKHNGRPLQQTRTSGK